MLRRLLALLSATRRGVAVAVVVVVVVAAVAFVVTRDGPRPVPDGPNVVVIMTDDQTLASLQTMPLTNRLLVDQGTSYANAVVSFPNCCPSRATYLTGQYAHTNGVRDNVGPYGGFGVFDESATLPVALERAGYDTIHIGKYLNGWGAFGDIDPPAGWTRWFGLIDPSTYEYYGFNISVDGEAKRARDGEYSTDLLAAEAVRQIRQREGDGRPFFLSFTPLAPHASAAEQSAAGQAGSTGGQQSFPTPVAPPRHEETFAENPLPRPPSYGEEDVSDKPRRYRRPPLTQQSEEYIARYQQAELGALAAVDEAVQQIMIALSDTDRLDDTVVIFTSDNGFMHGQHRFVSGKFFLYEPSIRVPLVIRGPGFAAGAEVTTPVVNTDLAPTISAVTGVDLLAEPDGLSVRSPSVAGGRDRAVLLENFQDGELFDRGVRTRRWALIEHPEDEPELYDLDADPDQMENLAGQPRVADVQAALSEVLAELVDCEGRDCFVPVPDVARG